LCRRARCVHHDLDERHRADIAASGFKLDRRNPFQRRVESRLLKEPIIWLTTVDEQGAPQPVPVWFLWDGSLVLVYSEPDRPKLHNIERNPRVALHFDGDGKGGDIIVISGKARIANQMPPATDIAGYATKYDAGGFYRRAGWSAEQFAAQYSVPIVIEPASLRGH
jgi:PPOX class probable F420-dependent enzyme